MQNSEVKCRGGRRRCHQSVASSASQWLAITAVICGVGLTNHDLRADTTNSDPSDPILNLFLQKGFITQNEADKARAEVQAMRTNELSNLPPPSKWKLDDGIKNIELYGDVRMRYEDRSSQDPLGGKIDLDRWRYALRFGFRGDAMDNVYYGFRLETASNPRSPWVTFGTSSSGTPYQGPFGKSEASLNIGQVYVGWRPTSWLDITVGKMANPLYTTPMVWDSDLNPEGFAEHFKYTIGPMDLFATFGQFIYADQNPNFASVGLGGVASDDLGQTSDNIFMFAWQGGFTYHITHDITAKVGATLYQYAGLQPSAGNNQISPYFGDAYVGEGAYAGPGSEYPYYGYSGYGNSTTGLAGNNSLGYPLNQVGVNDLLVVEVPFELDFKIDKLDAKIFGDASYNFEGAQRAQAAAAGYSAYLAALNPAPPNPPGPLSNYGNNDKAYQIGFAIGNRDSLGLVYGTVSRKNAWEFRTYWQHIEQFALDPNLIDSDFFEGAENLQGVYAAFAYGFTENLTGTFRYGYASRINSSLGTGGSDQDIPQVNPIEKYQLFQADLTFKF